jgi:hypothetical protein
VAFVVTTPDRFLDGFVTSRSVAPPLLRSDGMAESEDEERVSKKVVYEHTTSSGKNGPMLIVIAVIVIAIVVFIFMNIHH